MYEYLALIPVTMIDESFSDCCTNGRVKEVDIRDIVLMYSDTVVKDWNERGAIPTSAHHLNNVF